MYLINKVATLAGITVRTLHYYDEIGLLVPKVMNDNQYRIYSKEDIKTLQDILFFKELGFKLSDIKGILGTDGYNRLDVLKQHKKVIGMKMSHLKGIMETLESTINEEEGGIAMNDIERFEAFNMEAIEAHNKQFAKEIKEKYGQSDAYAESQQKTKQYDAKDWGRINDESLVIYKAFHELKNLNPNHVLLQEQVAKWQNYITRNFYTCTKPILSGLADMYIEDERFKENIDKNGEGIAGVMHDAIKVYCS
ncbi:MAG: MerR family transcriptional regulator [Vallitaleaceae bacterium]|jgi:DNA-binding transcriptional MerR regulator|nr:MerR family transcriptional regulator [Vallitaleaceae bacterium]